MRIVIAAVGRAKPGPARALFEDYARRLPEKIELREVEERRPLSVPERRRREAARLRAAVPEGAVVVALDAGGRGLSSVAFARVMADWRESGRRAVVFMIGGADGIDPALVADADVVLSLGAMTWPHLLVRGMLAEQLYRAHAIQSSHPYHRA